MCTCSNIWPLLLLLFPLVWAAAPSVEYMCDKHQLGKEVIEVAVVTMKKGCKYNSNQFVYFEMANMMIKAYQNSRQNASVTINETVFENTRLWFHSSTIPSTYRHIPFLCLVTRSRFNRSYKSIDTSDSLLYINGTLPYGSNITLRGNWMIVTATTNRYAIFEANSLSLSNTSVLVIADNNMTISGGDARYVWHQSDFLSITDHSHLVWENNTINVKDSRENSVYGMYTGGGWVLSGGSSFVLRRNTIHWSPTSQWNSSNISLLYCDNVNITGATVSIVDNNILVSKKKVTLRYLWEMSSNSSSVERPFTLYVCGNTRNGNMLSVAESHSQWLSEFLYSYLTGSCTPTQPPTLTTSPTTTTTLTHTSTTSLTSSKSMWLSSSRNHFSTSRVSKLCQ